MYSRIIIEGNAFYELDEECMRKKEAENNSRILKQFEQEKKRGVNSEIQKTRTS